jgi:hypothetical protein
VARLGVDYGQGFAIAKPVPIVDVIRELPTYAAASRQRAGEEVVLGANDETISAELQAELQHELIVNGIDVAETEEDIQRRMERIISGYGGAGSHEQPQKIAS